MRVFKWGLLFVLVIAVMGMSVFAEGIDVKQTGVKATMLVEASTGRVLQSYNEKAHLPIASVTKTMTMLLAMEAISKGRINYTDEVTVSEHAASMGGSQVFLEEGETISVDDLIKAVAVASGNDAAVALAEHISGSEPEFVKSMNNEAKRLGANNTHFINCNGLNETSEHYSSAEDLALISRELLKYPDIHKYLTIWMDTLRDGKFGLANTNKLIRFYQGANGIKTGSTEIAKYCVAASAKRDNMQLVAIVLGAPTTKDRFAIAKKLLDYGFNSYKTIQANISDKELKKVVVKGGVSDYAVPACDNSTGIVVGKNENAKITYTIKEFEFVKAPIKKNDKLGEIVFYFNNKEIGRKNIIAKNGIKRITVPEMALKLTQKWLMLK